MIAEIVRAFRSFSRPLRRQFWWPRKRQSATDRPGVVLISLDDLREWERKKLHRLLPHYQTLSLQDEHLPEDHTDEHTDIESAWASVYRASILTIRTATSFWRLLSGRTSLAQHLCESDDLARLHLRVMHNKCYAHLGTLHTKRISTIRRTKAFVAGLEWRHYEIWILARKQRLALVPAALPLPEVPLSVSELVQIARERPAFELTEQLQRRNPKPNDAIRIMSYNLHSAIGLDGRVSIRRVAEILHLYDPDFVALQELDLGCRRTNGVDQLEELKQLWPSEGEFLPLVRMSGGQYGIGFLSKLPVQSYHCEILPPAKQMIPQEPRGLQRVTVVLPDGTTLEVLNTHLGLTPKERRAQLKPLANHPLTEDTPQILTGDFNCKPKSREYRLLTRAWKPTQSIPLKTWFGTFPVRHLDYCFYRGKLEVLNTTVPRDSLTRLASDHLPLITDFRIDQGL